MCSLSDILERGGGAPSAVLFEPDCLRRDNPPSREKRQELAAVPDGGADGSGNGCLTPWDTQTSRVYSESGPFATLSAGERSGLNRQAVAIAGNIVGRADENGGHQLGIEDDGACYTLSTADRHAVCYDTTQITSKTNRSNPQPGDPCHTLSQGDAPLLCAAFKQNASEEVRLVEGDGSVAGALVASSRTRQTLLCVSQYGDIAGTLTARHDSSPCADRGATVICVADDNANAAVDDDVCGTLKLGGGAP